MIIYIPLGGNSKGDFRKYINIMIVFIICGFWHGNGFKFLAWGLLHGLFSVLTNILLKTRFRFLVKGVIGSVINFCLVTFAWIFFRVDSFTRGIEFICAMPRGITSLSGLKDNIALMEIGSIEIYIFIIAMLILIIADAMARSKGSDVAQLICDTGEIRRDLVFVLVAVIILVFGIYGETNAGKFIYMDF